MAKLPKAVLDKTFDQILEVLRRYAVYSHYRASSGSARQYAVFRRRADGSSEQCSEPMGHAEAKSWRDERIATDLLEEFSAGA